MFCLNPKWSMSMLSSNSAPDQLGITGGRRTAFRRAPRGGRLETTWPLSMPLLTTRSVAISPSFTDLPSRGLACLGARISASSRCVFQIAPVFVRLCARSSLSGPQQASLGIHRLRPIRCDVATGYPVFWATWGGGTTTIS